MKRSHYLFGKLSHRFFSKFEILVGRRHLTRLPCTMFRPPLSSPMFRAVQSTAPRLRVLPMGARLSPTHQQCRGHAIYRADSKFILLMYRTSFRKQTDNAQRSDTRPNRWKHQRHNTTIRRVWSPPDSIRPGIER